MSSPVQPVRPADRPGAVVTKRIAAVIDRLDVAMQFSTVDTAIAAQVLHAVQFAVDGPPSRTDDDWLPGIDTAEGLALVRALLPFVRAARSRPGPEAAHEDDEDDQ